MKVYPARNAPLGMVAVAVMTAAASVFASCGEAPSTADEDLTQFTRAFTAGQSACIIATDLLKVGDRSTTQSLVAAGQLDLGVDARLTELEQPGDVRTRGNALLRDRSTILGNLTVGGTLSRSSSAVVTGTIILDPAVMVPVLRVLTVTPGTTNVDVPLGADVTLPAGSYGDVLVHSRATLRLMGTYNVRSLFLEPDARLASTPTLIMLNASGNITFSERTGIDGINTPNLGAIQMYSNGSLTVANNVGLTGVYSAPLGDVQIRARSSLFGCVGGRNVLIDPDVHQTTNNVLAGPPVQ
jgi:hypothetical protein